MMQPAVWIVGDWLHTDFAAAVASLKEKTRCCLFDSPSQAITGDSPAPHSILLVQSRPGQISLSAVEQLHVAAPLARLVALLGPWCEGELRSGQPWPGVVRVPWRTWQTRLVVELGLDETNGAVARRLPRTASETDRLERTLQLQKQTAINGTNALICTDRKDRFESIADALHALGLKTHCQSPANSDADVVIFDGWDHITDLPPTPKTRKVLLLDFPRPEDHPRASAIGIDAVIALPLLLTDLAIAIERPQNGPS
jgi:hypothetical protein